MPFAAALTSCLTSALKCAPPSRRNCNNKGWVDRRNTSRVCHAVEICRQAGVPYSTLRTGTAKSRDFNIIKLALNIERDKLFDRINRRVDRMIEAGLEKEMFAMFDGTMDRHTAIERMKKNTRVYAKKQLTWYRRDPAITWVTPDNTIPTALQLLQDGGNV